jgi:PKD repeat protein
MHDFLWIRSYRPENGLEQPYAVLGVESVSLTCTTTALTDIVVNQTSDLNYNYGAVNVSTQSNFQSYSWNITNTANNASVFTSTLSNPSMTFPGEGTYNVCLDIIDSNGCCGTLCEVVEVECQDPVTTFNITGNCPNYTFVPTNLNENFDYTWYINGQAFGSTGVSTYTFTANGTYEIVLEVVNECGEVAKIATTITVDCICPPPLSNFNYVVSCDREANSVAFAFTGSGQGLTYSWSFGDGTTSTLQNPTHSYSGNGTYNVTLTVVDECGNTNTYTQSISVFCIITPSCIRNSNLIEATLDGGIHGITLSQAFTNLGIPFDPSMVNVYSNRHFNIIGTVTFDISTEFINCDFGALGGAKIVLDASLIPAQATNKGISTFYNCDFFGCLQMWQGIESVGHTSNFFGGSISDALYGIHVNNDGHLTTRGVEFNKNFIGMYFTASPSHLIVGNHFTGGGLLPGYQGMPTTANRNLCGIYSGGVTYSYDYTSSSGTYSLNVGDVDDVRNIFDHLENGIICVNTFNINVDNNEFLNLPIDAIPLSSNYGFNTPYRGVGVIVSGGGLFGGVYFEQNKFEQGTLGILGSSIPSVLSVKNNNRFSNVQHGIYAVNNGFIFPLNLIVENENSFDCRSKGVYSNNNAGHYFSIRKNTFNLTGNANQPNPAGFHGSALLPGLRQ